MNTTAVQTSIPSIAPKPSLWLATMSLWQREMVRFFRQRNRVIGSLATPLVFWLLLGSGLDRTFTPPEAAGDMGYLAYFYPGTIVLMLMFTAIFSTISVIEDRREGFLQGVLVAPIPRLAIVLGKVLGGASIATLQGLLMLVIWPLVGPFPGWPIMLGAIGLMFLVAVMLTTIGLLFAWPCDSTAGFHAIMNLILMPMWFLSSAVFPLATAPGWMQPVMLLNPLTYGQSAFSILMGVQQPEAAPLGLPIEGLIGVTIVITACLAMLATAIVCRPRKDGSA